MTMMPWLALAVLLAAAPIPHAVAGEATVTDLLLAVKHHKTCEITTRGRVSGNPHTVTVWFVADGERVQLGTLDATRDWVRNAIVTPEVILDFGEVAMRGTLSEVTDSDADAEIHDALQDKYWMARLGGWFGQDPERTFSVDSLALTTD